MRHQTASSKSFARCAREPESLLLIFALLQLLVLYVYEAWREASKIPSYAESIGNFLTLLRVVGLNTVSTRDSLVLLLAAAALPLGRPWAYLVATLASGLMAVELYHRMDGYWSFTLAHIPEHIVQFVFAVAVFSYAASCQLLRRGRGHVLS